MSFGNIGYTFFSIYNTYKSACHTFQKVCPEFLEKLVQSFANFRFLLIVRKEVRFKIQERLYIIQYRVSSPQTRNFLMKRFLLMFV